MIFNEWINEYKSKSVSVEGKVEAISEEKMEVEYNGPEGQYKSIGESPFVRKFSPIILTKNY